MQEYEQRVRKWLKQDDKYGIADKIPYFRDGVTNPEVWFAEGNDFRPLFILKEVSTGKDTVEELQDFLQIWKNKTCFDFAEYPFDDVKVGTFSQWKRVARLGADAIMGTSRNPARSVGFILTITSLHTNTKPRHFTCRGIFLC